VDGLRRPGVVVAVAAALAACGGAGASAPPDSGVRGIVLAGPTCPVEREGDPCPDKPLSIGIRILRRGELVRRIRSGADGRFRAALPPGFYVLDPVLGPGPPSGGPAGARVRAHLWTRIRILVDTGIR
jgi:hypothetical protein